MHRRPAPPHTLAAPGAPLAGTPASPQQALQRGRRFVRLYRSVLGGSAGAFIALALLVRSESVLLPIDLSVERAVQGVRLPGYGWLLFHVSDLGYPPLNVIVYVVVFVVLVVVGKRWEAALVVGSSLVADLVGAAVRQMVARPRPVAPVVRVVRYVAGYGFPSGHVMQYTTLFGFTLYLVLVSWRGGIVRAVIVAGLALLVALVGPSRVYLGAHWPSDILGAYLLGGLWLAGSIELHLAIVRRLSRRAASPAGTRAAPSAATE